MEGSGAILIQVTASSAQSGRFQFKVSASVEQRSDRRWMSGAFELPESSLTGDEVILPQGLAAALSSPSNSAVQHLKDILTAQLNAPVLVDLRAADLESAPWEALLDVPGFDPSRTVSPDRPVLRYAPRLADMALVPLTVPVDVLIAEFGSWPAPVGDQFPHPLKHFRAVTATRLDEARLYSLLRSTSFDIVHLRTRATRDAATHESGDAINLSHAAGLRRLLSARGCSARLVILETDQASLPVARQIAHRVLGTTGPAVIVTLTEHFDFHNFYYDITHDTDISTAFRMRVMLPPDVQPWQFASRPALLTARRGDETLKISPVERTLQTQAAVQARRAAAALEAIQEQSPRTRGAYDIDPRAMRLSDAKLRIDNVQNTTLAYHAESAGLEPMAVAAEELARASTIIANHEAQIARVVNTWFQRETDVLPRSRSLVAGARYQLHVMVGPRLRQSNIREPVAIPEKQLTEQYSDDGLTVRVVLFSTDFEVPVPEATMRLPRPPGPSEAVVFDVIAPAREGPARLRAGLYYRNNLLQSIMITATITAVESRRHTTGNVGDVEWVLSGSLQDLDRFAEKRISILTNETPSGTHLLAVVGAGIRQQLELGETELHRKVDEARGALQWVCGDPNKKEEYRFEPDNRGDKTRFREFLSGLAEFGYDLYADLVTGQDEKFEAKLEQALNTPATIQAVWMKSAKRVFPWALVYDLPIIPHPKNEVCPDFLQALDNGANASDVAAHPCFSDGCPYRSDTNIVCPSGFWGFRHVIEQPLSARTDEQQDEVVEIGTSASDAVDTIEVKGLAEILLGYSENLKRHDEHRQEVQAMATAHTDPHSDLFEIGKGLQRVDLSVVYFFCHGGNKRGKAWLGVGANPPDYLYASNLKAWNVKWPTIRPLVFINGCNTVGITPDDLLTFNQMLAWSRAAGVIGTEITVPETLGDDFGSRFLTGFLAGERVGELIRRLRLELLAEYNPLGLAYTPYCLANLHLVFN